MGDEVSQSSPVRFDIHVARLPKKGMQIAIEATERQRRQLASIHGLGSVESFRADLLASGWKRNGVQVTGRVQADIVQACVVTLEPVHSHIDEKISAVFLPELSKLGREGFESGGEILIDVDGPDAPETFSGDTVDVGALAEEFFALAIDPYPRKAGAAIESPGSDATDDDDLDDFRAKLRSLLPKS